MLLVQNPIIWLMRFRKRKGYGVHSPFAFGFVTDVLYNNSSYYAYDEMDRNLRWWQKRRVKGLRHLLFRLANFRHPRTMYCEGMDNVLCDASKYGAKGIKILSPKADAVADMILVEAGNEQSLGFLAEGTMMVVLNIHKKKEFWQRLKNDARITVTFDLYDLGIAFARKDLNKQHYVINW